MAKTTQRNYKCKDEELPVICSFVLGSLKNDQADFTEYSPKFSPEYTTGFETTISSVNEIVMPQEETLLLKKSTERLYATMYDLSGPIDRVIGYLGMAKTTLNISPADFGLTLLRKNIKTRNAEGTLSSLRIVNANLSRYNTELSAQGLTPALTSKFTAATEPIDEENKKQYAILSNRKEIVQNNISLFNSLNETLLEILRIGKILYKSTNPVKAQEYNFTALKKKVSSSSKAKSEPTAETPVSEEGIPVQTI